MKRFFRSYFFVFLCSFAMASVEAETNYAGYLDYWNLRLALRKTDIGNTLLKLYPSKRNIYGLPQRKAIDKASEAFFNRVSQRQDLAGWYDYPLYYFSATSRNRVARTYHLNLLRKLNEREKTDIREEEAIQEKMVELYAKARDFRHNRTGIFGFFSNTSIDLHQLRRDAMKEVKEGTSGGGFVSTKGLVGALMIGVSALGVYRLYSNSLRLNNPTQDDDDDDEESS